MPPQPRYNIKRIVIVGIIILVVLAIIGFIFLSRNRQSGNPGDKPGTIFPYPSGQPQTSTTSPTEGASIDETGEKPFSVESGERLRRITDYPVTGFTAFTEMRTRLDPRLNETTGQTELVPLSYPATTVRYNIKQNGFLADADITRDTIIISQKSATTIPAAEEIWFGRRGNPSIFRTFSRSSRTIETIAGTLPEKQALDFCLIPFTKDAAKGTKSTEVAELQRYLEKTLNTPITADGSFGTKTGTYLKQRQKELNVPETGILDAATRTAINADCAKRQADLVAEDTSISELKGANLPDNILRGTMSPDGERMFYLVNNGTEAVGIVADRNGQNTKTIFVSPFTEWMPQWASPDTITMTTMASGESNGYAYFLNPNDGTFTKVLGPLRGLTTLTGPDGASMVYSITTDQGIETWLYGVKTGSLAKLPLSTLAAKCGWKDASMLYCGVPKSVSQATYPDAWYQGVVTFEDQLWSINTATGTTSLLFPPQLSFDVTKIGFSPDKNYLFFINWIDQTLWSYRISG